MENKTKLYIWVILAICVVWAHVIASILGAPKEIIWKTAMGSLITAVILMSVFGETKMVGQP